jgi:hypothetical protein
VASAIHPAVGSDRAARVARVDALAYQRLGAFNTPIALAIATTKALLVAAIFMELRESRSLIIAFHQQFLPRFKGSNCIRSGMARNAMARAGPRRRRYGTNV